MARSCRTTKPGNGSNYLCYLLPVLIGIALRGTTAWGESVAYRLVEPQSWARVVEGVPPSTSYSLYGTAGENGWYFSDVQVTLTAEDNPYGRYGGGVELTQYQIDGGSFRQYVDGGREVGHENRPYPADEHQGRSQRT